MTEPGSQNGEKDDSWKKPLLLMVVFTSIPVVVIAVAFAVHSLA